jgi:hypothetical protein
MKTAWHTDIVVGGQGMNVKITQSAGCATLHLMPDVPGEKSKKAKQRFMKKFREAPMTPSGCAGPERVKKAVEWAVIRTGARWNRWHREAY